MWNLEEMAIGGSLVVTVAAVLALNNIKTPDMSIVAPATAADESVELAPATPPMAS